MREWITPHCNVNDTEDIVFNCIASSSIFDYNDNMLIEEKYNMFIWHGSRLLKIQILKKVILKSQHFIALS